MWSPARAQEELTIHLMPLHPRVKKYQCRLPLQQLEPAVDRILSSHRPQCKWKCCLPSRQGVPGVINSYELKLVTRPPRRPIKNLEYSRHQQTLKPQSLYRPEIQFYPLNLQFHWGKGVQSHPLYPILGKGVHPHHL